MPDQSCDLLCRRDDGDHPRVSVLDDTSRLPRHKRPCPGRILRGELRVRPACIDKVVVARRIIDVMKDFLKIDPGVRVLGTQGNRDDWQPLAQSDRPEPCPRTILSPADQYAIIACATVLERHTPAAAKQVDLQEVNRTAQQLLALGHILLASHPAAPVGGATQFEHCDQLAAESISDIQKRHASNVLYRDSDLRGASRTPTAAAALALTLGVAASDTSARPTRRRGSGGTSWT